MAKPFFQFRLLPVTLIACVLFTMLKIDEVARGQDYLAKGMLPPAYAANKAEDEPEEEKAVAKEEEAEGEHAAAEGEEEGHDAAGEAGNEEVSSNKNVSLTPPEDVVDVERRFNQIELDLLQNLSQRREEIEQYAEEVALREKLLDATELRIDKKIKQMDVMRVELQDLLEKNKVQEDAEMRSLVKIYESMKPKEAARIFNELDMNILLDVVDRMSERKAAPILANMDPMRAKDVTVKLAEMRRLRQQATKDIAESALSKTN